MAKKSKKKRKQAAEKLTRKARAEAQSQGLSPAETHEYVREQAKTLKKPEKVKPKSAPRSRDSDGGEPSAGSEEERTPREQRSKGAGLAMGLMVAITVAGAAYLWWRSKHGGLADTIPLLKARLPR